MKRNGGKKTTRFIRNRDPKVKGDWIEIKINNKHRKKKGRRWGRKDEA